MAKQSKIFYFLRWKRMIRVILVLCLLLTVFVYMGPYSYPVSKSRPQMFKHDSNTVGDFGVPVYYDKKDSDLVKESYTLYGFNQFVSDKIGVTRRLKDVRPKECKGTTFPTVRTRVSVIIVFYDEGWSTLMRTVSSVINMSPQNMLKEVILVDDHSSMSHLGKELDEYIKKFKGLIKVVRSPIHDGLIAARILGAEAATGDYLVFLDSHCEATTGWLEPLIFPIVTDYRVVTCPTIDIIDHNTFQYNIYGGLDGETARGTFSWQFYYKERPPTNEQKANRKSIADPIPSPVMAGGLFAISMKWWTELGAYDPGLFIWGGEQYELSFKVWMCGGSMFNIPCSRVGHVYRGPGLRRNDQGINSRHPNAVSINYKRVAEVWMDDYKHFLYAKKPDVADAENFDHGIEERKAIRRKNNCKSFRWYLENVINDTLYTAYEPDRAWDVIKNYKNEKCMSHHKGFALSECYYTTKYRWTWINEIRDDEHCMTVKGKSLISDWCREKRGDQHFNYDFDTKQIMSTKTRLCVTANPSEELVLEQCNTKNEFQKWEVKWKDLSIPEAWADQALYPPRQP